MSFELVQRFVAAITGSKKATAFVLGLVFLLVTPWLAKAGIEVTDTEKKLVVAALIAYLVGQGLADVGKEAKKIESGFDDDEPDPENSREG